MDKGIIDLRMIEVRIHDRLQGAYQNLLEVGRLLNEAKAGAWFEGEQSWSEWVQRHTGFSLRTAQRLMQAAREAPVGSKLEALPVSKIQTLLSLPEGEAREEMAERAQNMSVRELREEIEAYKLRLRHAEEHTEKLADRYADALTKEREAREEAEKEREALEDAMNELAEFNEADEERIRSEERERWQERIHRAEEEAERQSENAKKMREQLLSAGSGTKIEVFTAEKLYSSVSELLCRCAPLKYDQSIAAWPKREREALLNGPLRELNEWMDDVCTKLSARAQPVQGVVE